MSVIKGLRVHAVHVNICSREWEIRGEEVNGLISHQQSLARTKGGDILHYEGAGVSKAKPKTVD